MGCYPPLGKIVSKALGKCNGRERWRQERLDYLAYPPTEIHYMRPVARTVTFASNNSVYVIPPSPPPPQPQQQPSPPEPQQPQTPPQSEPEQRQHHDAPHQSQPPQPEQTEQEPPAAPAQTQDDAPPQAEPKPPKAPRRGGKKKQSGRVRFGPEPAPPQQQEQEQAQAQEENAQQGHGSGGGFDAPGQQGPHHGAAPAPGPVQQGQPGYLLRYTPSPLPRWEATPRRHEYFSGEYRSYYPTPVREGIYRIATDANRLTTIFSEENPNACTIV